MNIDNIKHISLSIDLQQAIDSDMANHFSIIPKDITNDTNVFYFDALKLSEKETIKEELKLIFNKAIILEDTDSSVIQRALSVYYRKNDEKPKLVSYGNDFLEDLIFEAKNINASDIHIEIYEEDVRVRLRVDGHLIEKNHIKKDNYLELINQIKIKSNLDITEKRLPQDGRIEYDDFDIRVSILPTHHGEKVVMRILGRDASHLNIDKLGLEEGDVKEYLEAVKKTNGIVLISGPTGSGKTTTLYATLKHLNDIKRNIVTVEDPIEYTLKGINQVQLKENIGLTFTSALRSFLRQDPDIIMLGEIRDAKTAQMAIRASLTGHLVLSTIHTNSAVGTISRLVDMDIPPFLIAETINISVAQRLLRVLCDNCKKEAPFNEKDLPKLFKPEYPIEKYYTAVGCNECYHTGYKGRTAIYEILPITHKVANAIKNNTLQQLDIIKGKKLSDKAFSLLSKGTTSLDEIYPILINS
ncbi:GspE/PulE family protein [Hyunsoonleella pacifica]|uniref:Type II/IV secretion system protein n=1 Tax=Hyunsoonleella pacifica TaxID=1080224 RepID=A0A4Q9FIS9_9FLAO|nr:GspE/PulE family protein [Hyunsoonleella pacifica]TBN11963.1 type II/IV secretion system protein [Hyunsoonleella pacifica]GGD07640.1 general secretion pathway protein GspE [Hyunsoonleella pacifica]